MSPKAPLHGSVRFEQVSGWVRQGPMEEKRSERMLSDPPKMRLRAVREAQVTGSAFRHLKGDWRGLDDLVASERPIEQASGRARQGSGGGV